VPITDPLQDQLHQDEGDLKVKTPEEDDERFWSVTTIIGTLDKPGLIYWAADMTAQAAVNEQATWRAMAEEDPDGAIEWLKNARFKKPKGKRSAMQLGTEVHQLCEAWVLDGVRPDADEECSHFLDRFGEWLDRWQPEYHATEVTVYSPRYGYAGTCDGYLTIQGERVIIDYKTSRDDRDKKGNPKSPYPEVALQLAAYRYAEIAAVWRPRIHSQFRRRYYLLGQSERDMAIPPPEVAGGLVIHITPERCQAYPIRCDETVHEAFLYVIEAARWAFSTSKDVIGDPLELAVEPEMPFARRVAEEGD